MEKWETDLRAKLEVELSDGFYECGSPPYVYGTGKGGKINFEVALQRESNRWTSTLMDEIESGRSKSLLPNGCSEYKTDYTLEEFEEMLIALTKK